MLCALILAGGKGTRFWPLSTESKPKQFLNLLGKDTMIQMTVNRIRPIIPIERIFICTTQNYVKLVMEQLSDIPKRNIIVETEGRNTAPCIALSSVIIERYYKDAAIVVLPSDQLIRQEKKFREIIKDSYEFIEKNKEAIVTLGIKPDRPETGYGYMKLMEESLTINNNIFSKVERFIEKPSKEKAEIYLREGRYLWNGGMFLCKTSNIINKVREYLPKTYEAIKDILVVNENEIRTVVSQNYSKTDATSIDYGILEKCSNIYVIKCDIGWDDIGTWKAIERYKDKDINNNIIEGNTQVIESNSNILINKDKRVILIGVNQIMTLETEDSIYIVNKDYMDNLRDYKGII